MAQARIPILGQEIGSVLGVKAALGLLVSREFGKSQQLPPLCLICMQNRGRQGGCWTHRWGLHTHVMV